MAKDPFKDILNKNFQQEVPSFDFTVEVMQKVEQVAETKTVLEPLIPQKGWVVIGAFYAIICLLPIVTGMQESALLFMDQINSIGFDSPILKQNVQLIFTIIFVFIALTFGDMILKKDQNQVVSL